MGVEGYYRVMRDLLPDSASSPEIPKLMRDVVESGGRGIANGDGFYQYTPEEAKAWEERFLDFNYKIRPPARAQSNRRHSWRRAAKVENWRVTRPQVFLLRCLRLLG